MNAFLASRKGEEQASAGDLKNALKTYRTAADTLSKIKQQWPNWQPELVEFRLKRTMEAINSIQGKLGPGAETNDAPTALVDNTVLPPLDTNALPEPAPMPPRPVKPQPTKVVTPKSTGNLIEDVKNQISSLETQLHDANERLASEQQKNEQLSKALTEAEESRKKAEAEEKKQTNLADVYQKAIVDLKAKGNDDTKKLAELEAALSTVKSKASTAEAERMAAEERANQLLARSKAVARRVEEGAGLPGKVKQLEAKLAEEQTARKDLTEKLTAMTAERDEARQEITRLKDANKQVDKLMAENASLLKKLGDAEKMILTFKADIPQKDAEIAALKKQVTDTQKALDASQEKNNSLQTEVGELRKKVDDYTKQIQQFKTDKTASAEERRKMEEENKLLQGIVMRVLQEDANRSQRKKMVQKELDRLQVQSDVLLKQINYLTEPVVKLSSSERRLFKRPIIDVQDPNTIVAIKTDATAEPAPAASAEARPAPESSAAPSAPAPASSPSAPAASAPDTLPEPDSEKAAPPAASKPI